MLAAAALYASRENNNNWATMSSRGAPKQNRNRFSLRASLKSSMSLGKFNIESDMKEPLITPDSDLASNHNSILSRRHSQPALNTTISTSHSSNSSSFSTTSTQIPHYSSRLTVNATRTSTRFSRISSASLTSTWSPPPPKITPPKLAATFIDTNGREYPRQVIHHGSRHYRKAGAYKRPIRRTQSLSPPGRHSGGGMVRPGETREICGKEGLREFEKWAKERERRRAGLALPPLGVRYSMHENRGGEGERRGMVVAKGRGRGGEEKGEEEISDVNGGARKEEGKVGVGKEDGEVIVAESRVQAEVPEEKRKATGNRRWYRHLSSKRTRNGGGEEMVGVIGVEEEDKGIEAVVAEGVVSGGGDKVEEEGAPLLAEGSEGKGKAGGKRRWSRLLAKRWFSH